MLVAEETTMVNTQGYVPNEGNDYITVEVVKKAEDKRAVIVPGTGEREFRFKDDSTGEEKVRMRPFITVEMGGHTYEWSLSPTANKELGSELGWETESWPGAVIKLLVLVAGKTEYVSATVIDKPLVAASAAAAATGNEGEGSL
jgi:hypothetical protein